MQAFDSLGPELAFVKHYWNSQFSISTLFIFFVSTDAADFPFRKSGRAENLGFSDMPPARYETGTDGLGGWLELQPQGLQNVHPDP